MIADNDSDEAPPAIVCLCGHGDDGKHTLMEDQGGGLILCPSCPSGMMFGFNPAYVTRVP